MGDRDYFSAPLSSARRGANIADGVNFSDADYASAPTILQNSTRDDSTSDALAYWSWSESLRFRGGNIQGEELDDDEAAALLGLEKSKDHLKQTPFQASLTMIKAVVGAGSFALPFGFSQAGLWGGIVGITLLGILSAYTIQVLIEMKNKMGFEKTASYVDIVRKELGRGGAIVTYIAMCLTSLGACSGYLIFCATTLNEMFPQLATMYYVMIICGLIVPLTWLRSFKYLAFTAILGDVAIVVGVATVLIFGFINGKMSSPFDTERYVMWNWSTYPVFFGSAAFLFCIHMLAPPVEQNMQDPRKFPKTLNITFVIVTVLNLAFATICYMLFGDKTAGIVVSNLGNQGVFVYIAKFALVVDLFFTFLVVIVPAREIIENRILKPEIPHTWWRNLIRFLMVAISGALAIAVKNFGTMIGLVSGLALSLTAFILPPIIRFSMSYPMDQSYRPWKIAIDFFVFLFGLFASVATTYMSLMDLLQVYGVDTCNWLPQTWGHCP